MTPFKIALVLAGYALFVPLLWQLGNLFVKRVVDLAVDGKILPEAEGEETPPAKVERELKAGRVIGLLERVLLVVGLVWGNWQILAAVIALKSVTRYKDLDKRLNAEYFLIGSLSSIIWAVVVAILIVAYDREFGFGVLPHALLETSK